jgi:hypothetical protein
VRVPVIASGGVGTLDHLVEGIRDGHATAVLAASIFHFGTYTIGEAKDHMAAAGHRLVRPRLGEPPGNEGHDAHFTLADLEKIVAARAADPARVLDGETGCRRHEKGAKKARRRGGRDRDRGNSRKAAMNWWRNS